jgi:hypothetical protein
MTATRISPRTALLGGDGASASRPVIDTNFDRSTHPVVVSIAFADSPFTAELTDGVILADATGGAITVIPPTLADAAAIAQRLCVVKVDSSGNAVTINPPASELWQFATTKALASQGSKSEAVAVASLGWVEV